ncbi:MAG: biotin/lipoyl-containing protein, partial [Flavobacteriales bacterium]
MGESVAEATIIKWVKKEGDKVTADEPIIEIATDKVDSEVPSPEDGILLKCLVKEGDVVAVGQPIALISTGASSAPVTAPAAAAPAPVQAAPAHIEAATMASPLAPSITVSSSEDRFYSPLVKSIAKTEGISQAELDAISGSGQGGRVTKNDILNYIATRGKATAAVVKQESADAAPAHDFNRGNVERPVAPAKPKAAISISGNDEIIEMDRMRKLIA